VDRNLILLKRFRYLTLAKMTNIEESIKWLSELHFMHKHY